MNMETTEYLGKDFSNSVAHWKYVDKYRGKNGDWIYVYDKKNKAINSVKNFIDTKITGNAYKQHYNEVSNERDKDIYKLRTEKNKNFDIETNKKISEAHLNFINSNLEKVTDRQNTINKSISKNNADIKKLDKQYETLNAQKDLSDRRKSEALSYKKDNFGKMSKKVKDIIDSINDNELERSIELNKAMIENRYGVESKYIENEFLNNQGANVDDTIRDYKKRLKEETEKKQKYDAASKRTSTAINGLIYKLNLHNKKLSDIENKYRNKSFVGSIIKFFNKR